MEGQAREVWGIRSKVVGAMETIFGGDNLQRTQQKHSEGYLGNFIENILEVWYSMLYLQVHQERGSSDCKDIIDVHVVKQVQAH